MSTCKIIRRGENFQGKGFSGISAESAGSKAICMHLLEMPPGAEAKPYFHEGHETAIYVLEGAAEFRHGANLEHHDRVEAGDFIYYSARSSTSALQFYKPYGESGHRPHRSQ
jgi:uncharacterized RmlC-like cupin family protein